MEYHSAAQKEYSELHAHVTKNSASEREKQAYYYLLNKYILDQLTNN